ncbi:MULTISPECIES: HD domain-containing protein [unclassified Vibrio]|uniref:HD domain-containing protein n=1 Tax=Vibrio sp. HB236076 TaxID=3232307 RepID=A0AB39HJT9_9VIBR|nr:HD domain-containing protein [Vibrio sp. HB161653]MDP5253257.1 HD domain-containing protein [Vibrio sp. HB161653]
MSTFDHFEPLIRQHTFHTMGADLAHDAAHISRVVKSAKTLAIKESANLDIVMPAAYLHDLFSYGKDHPLNHQSSLLSADNAIAFLTSIEYPNELLSAIHHAIHAHSYSANIAPTTLEAKIVQDADRLDALGAIGIARTIQVSSHLNRPLYQLDDPFANHRALDDSQFCLDHFYTKLLNLVALFHTTGAKQEAQLRTDFMSAYLRQLGHEIES